MNVSPGAGPQSLAHALGVSSSRASLGDAALEDLGLDAQPEVVRPAHVDEVAAIVRETPAGRGLVTVGAGTGLCVGRVPRRVDLLLDLSAMPEVVEHSTDDFVVSVPAGTRLQDLQERLGAARQWLPVEPPDASHATLGGMVGAAATSALAASLGTLRTHLLGVKFVRGDGKVARAGGKVVKNVSGYDVMKLLHGSLGTLAVITEATFRTRPRPEKDVLALAALDSLQGALMTASRWCEALSRDPATMLVHSAMVGEGPVPLLLRLQGAAVAVDAQCAALNGAQFVDVTTGAANLPTPWQSAVQTMARGTRPGTLHAVIGFPLGRRFDVAVTLQRLAESIGRPVELTVDSLRHVAWIKVEPHPSRTQQSDADDGRVLEELRARLRELDARLHIHSAPAVIRDAAIRDAHPAAVHELHERIRREFDPNGILSPGRLQAEPA